MKVYLVFQSHGDYEDYIDELVGCCSTMEKAQKLKQELDEGCSVGLDDLNRIMPVDVYDDWMAECDYEERDVEEYKGHTLEEFKKYQNLQYIMWENYRPCRIKVWELDGDAVEEESKRRNI